MRRRWLLLFFFLFLIALIGWAIYQTPWLRTYWRVQVVMRELPVAKQEMAWREFDGQESEEVVAGLLVGSWLEKVVIFNSRGLHVIDTNIETIYSVFNGCQEAEMALLKKGAMDGDRIPRVATANYDEWKNMTQAGEYVLIYHPTKQENGRRLAREVNYYNFWVFLPRGIERQCAK